MTIEVHDITGTLVASFNRGVQEIGTFQTTLDLSGLSSGVYFYTIHAGSYRETKMLTVAR